MALLEYELKLQKFENDEFEEIIGDTLNLKDELFIEQVKERVSLLLEDFYTDSCL